MENIDLSMIWILKNFVSRNSIDAQPSELHDIYKLIRAVEEHISKR